MKKKMDNKGFSLVELIIVIAIMVILVAVLAPQYLKYVEKSRVSTDTQTTVEFINALQVLAADPDVMLDTSETNYKVTSGPAKSEIKVEGVLQTALKKSGQLADTDFDGDNSTSSYQSSGYTAADISIALEYNSSNNTWSVVTTGVDSAGRLP